jgi:phage repressor protein C with HTH and peptisase S24 domain
VSDLARRVRDAAKKREVRASAFGRKYGVPSSSLTNYWNGVRVWPTELLIPLSRETGVSVEELLTGVAPLEVPRLRHVANDVQQILSPEGPTERAPNNDNSIDLVELEEIDLAYGLGGTFADGAVEVTKHRFPQALLAQLTTSPAGQVTLARGRGDSMEPTIHDGDLVMIDRSQRIVREQDLLWALTVGAIAMIKRVRVKGERVTLLSDNDRVPPDECHHEEVNIVGRVFFIGRRV